MGAIAGALAIAASLTVALPAYANESASGFHAGCGSVYTVQSISKSGAGKVAHNHNSLGPKWFVNTSPATRYYTAGLQYSVSWYVTSTSTLESATASCVN